LLVSVLEKQYGAFTRRSEASAVQIEKLGRSNTFTVATAHQPSLLLGPLYFIYKAVSAIKLADRLAAAYPAYTFVPIFVLGAEDHDFEEVNHAHLFGKTLVWQSGEQGATGMMSTASLGPVLDELAAVLGAGDAAADALARVRAAYQGHETYGLATAQLIDSFLGEKGLLVIDMNVPDLKRAFLPIMQRELLERPSRELVEATQAQIQAALGFGAQAHARDINLFYLRQGLRERIERQPDGVFKVVNTDLAFSAEEIQAELEQHPERFSPNVVVRPLFQETILPNLAYVGGGGELAYWLERRRQFEHFGAPFPVLIRRNSALWIDQGVEKRMDKLGLSIADLLEDTDALIRKYVGRHSAGALSLTEEKAAFAQIFEQIAAKAEVHDPTLAKAVMAEYARQSKVVESLEDRLLRAEKQRHEVAVNQIRSLKDKLFPGHGLQERHDNFLPYWLRGGETWLNSLLEALDPLEDGLVVFSE
jgi:bacillithiol biosynthesis cysteine-adding enzyme BshC